MIERTFDADVVNAVSNHYSVFPTICGGQREPLDAASWIDDENNVCLVGEWGLAIFHCTSPGKYEAHYRVLPQGRGKWALSFLMIAIQWMFLLDDTTEIRCRVPRGNYACRAIVRRVCAHYEFTMPKGWLDEYGNVIEADVYSMSRERWDSLTQTRN